MENPPQIVGTDSASTYGGSSQTYWAGRRVLRLHSLSGRHFSWGLLRRFPHSAVRWKGKITAVNLFFLFNCSLAEQLHDLLIFSKKRFLPRFPLALPLKVALGHISRIINQFDWGTWANFAFHTLCLVKNWERTVLMRLIYSPTLWTSISKPLSIFVGRDEDKYNTNILGNQQNLVNLRYYSCASECSIVVTE